MMFSDVASEEGLPDTHLAGATSIASRRWWLSPHGYR